MLQIDKNNTDFVLTAIRILPLTPDRVSVWNYQHEQRTLGNMRAQDPRRHKGSIVSICNILCVHVCAKVHDIVKLREDKMKSLNS